MEAFYRVAPAIRSRINLPYQSLIRQWSAIQMLMGLLSSFRIARDTPKIRLPVPVLSVIACINSYPGDPRLGQRHASSPLNQRF
jgi:hypothetical protein